MRAGAGDMSEGTGRGRAERGRDMSGGTGRLARGGPLLALLAGLGCGPEPALDGPAVRAAAEELWRARCGNCHGVDGRGDGPSGRALDPRPRDFHDAAWQARVDDAHLRRVIVEGGAAHGLSRDMAANPDLADRPAIVEALLRRIRGFR